NRGRAGVFAVVKRSSPQREIDDRAFPVRVLIFVPREGYGRLIGSGPETINSWLDREIGRADYGWHSGGSRGTRDVSAFYFRHPSPAARFLEAFPQLEIADGTMERWYASPALP